LRLPVLERPLQPLVARQTDVVGNLFGGDHCSFQLPVTSFQKLPVLSNQ
jgi:hypothetical protein